MPEASWDRVSKILADALELQPGAQREAFLSSRCHGEPELRAELDSLLDAGPASGELEETALPPVGGPLTPGERLGAYRITEKLGAGGMGVIYRAERADGQFERSVAIKVMPETLLSAEAAHRFRAERAILAGLKHANITELLDAGITAVGLPYLVMELVEGAPITEYAEREKLSVRDRVALVREACQALHYAHQHLVIHRDIKPANILVDAQGRPKLLDFGVARLLESPAGKDPTTDLRRMTPNFASPEQLRGELLSTSTDIYSLGVVLYCLLSGERPYDLTQCSLAEAIRMINEDEPPPPSRKAKPEDQKEILGDLDAIVQKAMAKSPADRYVSAQEFSQDLGYYLEGRPVSACRHTRSYVVRKFIARRRRTVIAAAAALLLVSAGIGAILQQSRVANRERMKADQRFQQVRRLANSILFEFQRDLAKLAGAMEVRRKMIASAKEHLEVLSQDATEIGLRRELAAAYGQLADLQGGVNWSLGDWDGALGSYSKERTLLEGILAERPADQAARRELIIVLGRMVSIARKAGRDDQAGELASLRERLVEDQFRRRPREEDAMESMANLWFARAQATRNMQEQARCLSEALGLFTELLEHHAGSPYRTYDVAITSKTLASTLIELKDLGRAQQHAERALELDASRVAGDPLNSRAKLDQTYSLNTLAYIRQERGNGAKAVELYRQSLSIREELWRREPGNERIRGAYVSGLLYLARSLAAAGSYAESLRHCQASMRILDQYHMEEPGYQELRRQMLALMKKNRQAIESRTGAPQRQRTTARAGQ